jgi:molecular chaperone DnaJ
MSKDYYKILGIGKNATPDEIKKAYRRLAHEHHPDKGGNQEKFKEVNEAYQVLSDERKRSQYDQFGTTFEQARARGGAQGFEGFRDFSSFADAFNFGQSTNGGAGFEDIFETIFGGQGAGRAQRGGRRMRRGQNINIDTEISLEEAYKGVEREISLRKNVICSHCQGTGSEPGSKMNQCLNCRGQGQIEQRTGGGFFSFSQVVICPKCAGSGKIPEKACVRCGGQGRVKETSTIKVKIPAGISDGQTISLQGQGEAAPSGGVAGDLYMNVHVKNDPRFKREGDNLIYELPITFSQAALGDKVEIPTLSGWIKLKVPEGVESGTVIRLESKGMPHLSRRSFGDMMVKIKVKTPKRLSRKAKELLEELKKEGE